MKQIAKDLGLSVQSVSYALRGRKGVSEQTRLRIRNHATKLGYEPDAGLRALADFRTSQCKVATRWNTVALVHNWPTESAFLQDEFYGRLFNQLKIAAKERGITIVPYWLGAECEFAQVVFRKMRDRGITGVLVAPPRLALNEPRINFPAWQFQIVTFGPEHLYPDLHTVQFDFYENLRLAWRVLRERGRQRIGLVYAKHQGWRTGYAWRAAYHVEKLLAGGTPGVLMPLELEGSRKETHAVFIDWLRKDNYDAVISSIPHVADWVREEKSDCEVAIFNASLSDQQGIDLNLPLMAQTAIELLYIEMQRSLQQDQRLPFRVHIPGHWVDGSRKQGLSKAYS